MTSLRITRLRRRFGITEAHARLMAELFYGGTRND